MRSRPFRSRLVGGGGGGGVTSIGIVNIHTWYRPQTVHCSVVYLCVLSNRCDSWIRATLDPQQWPGPEPGLHIRHLPIQANNVESALVLCVHTGNTFSPVWLSNSLQGFLPCCGNANVHNVDAPSCCMVIERKRRPFRRQIYLGLSRLTSFLPKKVVRLIFVSQTSFALADCCTVSSPGTRMSK